MNVSSYDVCLFRRQAIIWTNVYILSIGALGKKLQLDLNQNTTIFVHENAFVILLFAKFGRLDTALKCWRKLISQISIPYNTGIANI